MTHDEIYNKVQGVLVDALGVDEDEVKPDAIIQDDLGAESIDFLDIQFRLEKAFGIKIPRGEMMPAELASDTELVQNGRITPAGVEAIRSKMPHADLSALPSDPKIEDMSKLFTVNFLVKYVQGKLASV